MSRCAIANLAIELLHLPHKAAGVEFSHKSCDTAINF